jgi:hypothetical protein
MLASKLASKPQCMEIIDKFKLVELNELVVPVAGSPRSRKAKCSRDADIPSVHGGPAVRSCGRSAA